MGKEYIPLSIPNLAGNELEYVTKAIKENWVSTGGPYVKEFEEKIANYVNAKGAVACQSGTAGIHVALQILGVSQNDEVIVPTLTFIASVNPVKYLGAEPIFIDCDDNLTLDPVKLEEFCQNECQIKDGALINKRTKRVIKGLVVVHVFGNMADMEKIMEIAERYNLKVVEDAAEALGTYYKEGKYKGKFAGTIGDIGIYSFNGNKIITTGGGGMIVSNDEEILKMAKHLTTQAKTDELYYIHDEIGYNYRMTNLQAALGIAQLEQLEEFIKIKGENYSYYKEKLTEIKELELLDFSDKIRPNFWFYSLFIHKKYNYNRDQLIKYLLANNVQTRPIWGLINEQKPYINNQAYKIEKAKFYLEHIINLPCSSNLKKDDIDSIIDLLKYPHN